MAVINPTNFQGIADNIAKTLVDLETAYQTNPTNNAPLIATITAGQIAVSNSLSARVAALDDINQQAALANATLNDTNNVIGWMNISVTAFYALFKDVMAALDAHTGGLNLYLAANQIEVHSEFANAFNYVAANAPSLGVASSTLSPISPVYTFIPNNITLGSIMVTGAASGTFTPGSVVDLTQFAAAPFYLQNISGSTSLGTSTAFSITYVDGNGNTQTVTPSLSGAMANMALQALSVNGASVSNIAVTSGGVSGDIFAVIAAPLRTVTY